MLKVSIPSVVPRLDAVSQALARRPFVSRALLAVAVLTFWVVGGGVVWFSADLLASVPGKEVLSHVGTMSQATTLLAADGKPAFTIFKEQRIEIPLSQVSPIVIRAVLAIEDQRFFEHKGVDTIRIVGSALANLRLGRRAQGGSTLTQQLARQSFLTREKTLRRKLQEVILAAELEAELSKNDILELYLNKVYFGDGLHGIEAASRGFFGKHASELTLGEAALIAGLVKSPSTYAPTINLDRATARRAVVLQAMADSGAITADDADRARREPVKLKDGLNRDDPAGAWFKEEVRRELVARFGLARVYEGGLKVYTTIDPALQLAAEQQVAKTVAGIEARRAARRRGKTPEPASDPLQAAVIAIDPASGEVRALVGGRSFEDSPFDRATQAHRQPGSAFKPFVYATALEQGWEPASVVDRLDEPIQTLQGDWMPEDEHADAPEMTLRTALRTSSNRAAVRLLQEVGIDKTIATAKLLGVGSIPSVPSLALGSGEVTLRDLTAAYAAFASQGLYRTPIMIRRVETADGTVLFEGSNPPHRAVSEQTAFLLTSMLSDVINYGTGAKARQAGFMLPAAGKTGTTNDYVDAWFVGFTPAIVTGVWIGYDQPRTILAGGYAGEIAVPLWAEVMKVATAGAKPDWFTPPKGIVTADVCRLSGKLPANGCTDVEVVSDTGETSHRSMIYTDYFRRADVPTAICPLHPGASLLNKFAGLFGKGHPDIAPVSASKAGLPPASDVPAVAVVQPAVAPMAGAPPPAKKRGFWSKVFGRSDKNAPPPPPPNPQ